MKNTLFTCAVVLTVIGFTSCNMYVTGSEKNKEAMRDVIKRFESGSVEGLEKYVAADVVEHTPPPDMDVQGLEGLKTMIKMNHEAVPDCKITELSVVAEGDLVIYHYNMKGTNTGAWGNMPATNKSFDMNGVDMVKFKDGKAVEHWGYFEESKYLTQLGLMPPMGPPAATDSTTTKTEVTEEKKKG